MKTIVQLRGLNASGKSTTVRQFVEKEHLEPTMMEICGIKTRITRNERIAVLGWYKPVSNTEGCDGNVIRSRDHLLAALQEVIKMGYRTIIFEGLIYGKTFKLAEDLFEFGKKRGYQYIPIDLVLPYDEHLKRLMYRNGGNANINFDIFDRGLIGMRNARQKMKQIGIPLRVIDVSKVEPDQMWKIIADVVEK